MRVAVAAVATGLAAWALALGGGPLVVAREVRVTGVAGTVLVGWGRGDVWSGAEVEAGRWQRMPARGDWDITARPGGGRCEVRELAFGVTLQRREFGINTQGVVGRTDGRLAMVVDTLAAWALAWVLWGVAAWLWARSRRGAREDAAPKPGGRALLAAAGVVVIVHGGLAAVSPLWYCPDSMDYAVRALGVVKHGTLDGMDLWRPPGFSLLLAGLMALGTGVAGGLGVVHVLAAGLTSWMAGRLASRLAAPGAGPWWGVAAALGVGLDPVVLMWSRHAMPEMTALAAATACAWLAAGVGCGTAAGSMRRGIVGAVGAGLAAGVAACLRSNLQVLVVAAPVIAAFGVMERGAGANRAWRAAVVGGVALAAGGVLPALWTAHNAAAHGVPAFVTGTQYARVLNGVDSPGPSGRAIDFNQLGIVSDATRGRWMAGPVTGAVVVADVVGSELMPRREGEERLAYVERRLGRLADESAARWPERRFGAAAAAAVSVSGLWPLARPGYRENAWWARGLRGEDVANGMNFWNGPDRYPHLDRALCDEVYRTGVESTADWRGSWMAAWFGRAVDVAAWVRPLVAALAVLSGFALAWRGRLAGAGVAWLGVGHAAALGLVTMSGIDRYGVPLWGVMWAAAAAFTGGSRVVGGVLGRVRGAWLARTAPRAGVEGGWRESNGGAGR